MSEQSAAGTVALEQHEAENTEQNDATREAVAALAEAELLESPGDILHTPDVPEDALDVQTPSRDHD